MDFKMFLHQIKFVLTFYNISKQNLVWGTKNGKTSILKEPLSEKNEFC